MSAESRRHLTHRRTRFRSSTNNELGTVADEVDVAQHIYPNKLPSEPKVAAKQVKAITLQPAGFIGLGFAMLFMGLHQCMCIAAAQFLAGVRDRARTDGGMFGFFFHGTQSLVWMMMTLQLQLQLAPAPHLLSPDDGGGGESAGKRSSRRGKSRHSQTIQKAESITRV
ncbi:hypothetical protein NLG97_g9101 [Lecanicillium saksenae]|uniref:Uncharacterized protein n=1 Tax=Lecanicillium saksenae TaxID=468837 RepID=A0ACC1QHH7_9HYPO|nr:hypothetical protein NLG97_g9101 [Lecanicillium saksenae]